MTVIRNETAFANEFFTRAIIFERSVLFFPQAITFPLFVTERRMKSYETSPSVDNLSAVNRIEFRNVEIGSVNSEARARV